MANATHAPVTYRGAVYPWHCDHMGHMNVAWYVSKLDEATWNLFATLGITPAYLRDGGRGMVAVEMKIRYLRELRAGDVVEIVSRVLEVREKVLRFVHEMRDGVSGETSAVAEIVGVHIDTARRKSCPLPDEIRARAEAVSARD